MSAQVKATLTFVLFHPAPFGLGEAPATVVGAIASGETTVSAAVPLMLPDVAVIVLVPALRPLASPFALIVATPVLLRGLPKERGDENR